MEGNIKPSGGTDFFEAFKAANNVLLHSGATSGCQKVVLFLTDGAPDYWGDDEYETLRANHVAHDVVVFGYALGDGANQVRKMPRWPRTWANYSLL